MVQVIYGALSLSVLLILGSLLITFQQRRVNHYVNANTIQNPMAVKAYLSKRWNRVFIHRRYLKMFELTNAISCEDEAGITAKYKELCELKLNEDNLIGIHQKLLEYCIAKGKMTEAEFYYQKLILLYQNHGKADKDKWSSIQNETEALYQVYVQHNLAFKSVLEKHIRESQSSLYKAVCYFRIAKLWYYNGDLAAMKAACQLSMNYCQGSVLFEVNSSILQGKIEMINAY